MKVPKSIKNLAESFERLPGIGPKTAQRLTFYLLHFPQDDLKRFAGSIENLKTGTKICNICKHVDEDDPCSVCTDSSRDTTKIAVVENVLDVWALEKAGFRGLYHVLHGVVSPLNGIGPEDIFLYELISRLRVNQEITELIMATNSNLEGESTAMFISKLVKEDPSLEIRINLSRLARGLPVGGDIEYADEITLKKALEGRGEF